RNVGARFIERDVRDVTGAELSALYPKGHLRLLAGCAPCRPFSPWRHGYDTEQHSEWKLLQEFTRLVNEIEPDLVTMENVPDLQSTAIFKRFVRALKRAGYDVDHRSVYCPRFGIPQHRRRLVLLASKVGPVKVPEGRYDADNYRTVRDAIGNLPPVAAGEADPRDRLHKARAVTPIMLKRLQASRPGGTWRDWPKGLRAKCHVKKSGASFQDVYSRMMWDDPSPTITTLAHSFGSGRFGHPDQDRALTLREAAILQSFPRRYRFVEPRQDVGITPIARLIGNAVPPRLGRYIGLALARAAASSS
ncbi:MAG: DNA cytosine methyltransferase, partial [Chloroflexi bacterium]